MPSIRRRRLLGYGVTGLGAAMLGATTVPLAADAQTTDKPLLTYDLAHLYSLDLGDPAQAEQAYDELQLVATVQGIVNRTRPRLYAHFVTHNEFGNIDIDQYWLNELRRPGGLLADRPLHALGSLDELLSAVRSSLAGAVVWDPAVPSTSNVAATVAGAQDLVAIRYDETAGSLYQRYVTGDGPITLPVKVWLVDKDGSSRFTGQGMLPGTTRPSSGSAKCDAYLWAVEKYLRTGRVKPEFGYYLDAYWLRAPLGKLQQTLLSNRDYLVSRRGFFFDLLPWDDETPVDDPDQPLGTDQRTLEEILRVGYEQSRGACFPVHGFVPWGYKYTTVPPAGGGHDPVPTEWRFVQVASAFNAYLDADAENIDAMANSSIFQHVPLESRYPQANRPTVDDLKARGFVDENGAVVPRRYVTFYVGDYDSAAWLYQMLPHFWDDPARGSVPLNWAFNPNLSARMPAALAYTRRTATANDTFVAGDSGAGYVNPGMLIEPREFSGLPSGVEAWKTHCAPHYERWDLTVTGFVIDGYAPPMDEATLRAYAEFSPDGFAAQKVPTIGLVGDTPYVRMGPDLPRAGVPEASDALQAALTGDLSGPPAAPEFHSIRTILEPPSWHRDVVATVNGRVPDAAMEVVDAHTFYALVRQHQS